MLKKFVVLTVLICSSFLFANSAPMVTGVSISQRTDGSGTVDIWYTLSDANNDRCSISVLVSDNGGSSLAVSVINSEAIARTAVNILLRRIGDPAIGEKIFQMVKVEPSIVAGSVEVKERW